MSLNITSIILVGMSPEAAALARSAAREVFPGAAVSEAASLEAAGRSPGAPGAEILLLGESAAEGRAQAASALDARGLPRWPVIIFGPRPPDALVLPPEDWNPRAAARLFRSAAAAHALARDNARLRGDLYTIGRRVVHDLRTPLMGLSTACEAIDGSEPEGGGPSRKAYTESITASGDEITRLVDRISGVLKATAEVRAKEAVPMRDVVWAALQRLERRRLERGAEVAQPSAWPTVPGVPAWLELIWGNLLANALDHGGEKPRLELGWKEEAGGWRFWVADSGPGVPERKRATLFYPFDLLHRPSAPRGWGLSIVHRLVELQGGACGYEPGAAGGARFFFTLPA